MKRACTIMSRCIGLTLLVTSGGCLYIPTVVEAEPHFNGGPAPADAPIWVVRDANCRGFLLAFAPPPAGPHRTREYYARLEFGEGDILSGFEVRREREWRDAGIGMMVPGRDWVEATLWPQIEARTERVARCEAPHNQPMQRTAAASSGAVQ